MMEEKYIRFLSHKLKNNRTARYFLIKDLYQIGMVLQKKYVLLKRAYTFAVTGVILFFAFIVVSLFI